MGRRGGPGAEGVWDGGTEGDRCLDIAAAADGAHFTNGVRCCPQGCGPDLERLGPGNLCVQLGLSDRVYVRSVFSL